jgi:hypothetical protein
MSVNGNSQTAKEDFAKINNAYVNNSQLSMKVKYELYKNNLAKEVFQVETGEIKRNGNNKYTKIGNIETIENDKYRVIVDHDDKNISLLSTITVADETPKKEELYLVNLEKMLAICSKVEFKEENKVQNSYLLMLPNEEYSEIKIIVNKKTFFIEKMILYYSKEQNIEDKEDGSKEPPRMEISYYDFNLKPQYTDADFTYYKFLEKRNGKLLATPAFKTYTVNTSSYKN